MDITLYKHSYSDKDKDYPVVIQVDKEMRLKNTYYCPKCSKKMRVYKRLRSVVQYTKKGVSLYCPCCDGETKRITYYLSPLIMDKPTTQIAISQMIVSGHCYWLVSDITNNRPINVIADYSYRKKRGANYDKLRNIISHKTRVELLIPADNDKLKEYIATTYQLASITTYAIIPDAVRTISDELIVRISVHTKSKHKPNIATISKVISSYYED